MIPGRWARGGALLGAVVGVCACASGRPSDLDFDPRRAVTIRIEDDLVLVEDVPTPLTQLRERCDAIFRDKGVTGRRSGLVLIRYGQKPGENLVEFEQRKQARTQEVLAALAEAGIRNVHLGPYLEDRDRSKRRTDGQMENK